MPLPPAQGQDAPTLAVCGACDVDCCSGRTVPVTLWDVMRLMVTLNLHPREFVTVVDHAAWMPVQPFSLGSRVCALVLRQREDSSCAFLVRLGAHRRCGVHALRPDACRVFPFVANLALQQSQPNGLAQLPVTACPWQWPHTPVARVRALQDLEDAQLHRAVEQEWWKSWDGTGDVDALWALLSAGQAVTAP